MPLNAPPLSEHARAAFAKFIVTQKDQGVRAALGQLLETTDFRFIGIWLFNAGKANAAVHIDRENPSVERVAEVPDTATYCHFVRESGEPFATPNAMADTRLSGHIARSTVLSYCGVPVQDVAGKVIGTLCLYDVQPRDVSLVETDLLARASSYLSLGGHVPSYPSTGSTQPSGDQLDRSQDKS